MTKKYLVFNWKMSPSSAEEALELLEVIKEAISQEARPSNPFSKIIVLPPCLYLYLMNQIINADKVLAKKITLGAQDVFWHNRWAVTGGISPKMLKNAGARYVLIGHSERQQYFKETAYMINQKIKAALVNNLIPIICVGEKEKRDVDSFLVKKCIFEQLNNNLAGIKLNAGDTFIIAYEPIWAISSHNQGQGQPESLDDINKMIGLIRFWVARRFSENIASKMPILYGGSVTGANINLFAQSSVADGVLVGRASTKKQELKKIFQKLKRTNRKFT